MLPTTWDVESMQPKHHKIQLTKSSLRMEWRPFVTFREKSDILQWEEQQHSWFIHTWRRNMGLLQPEEFLLFLFPDCTLHRVVLGGVAVTAWGCVLWCRRRALSLDIQNMSVESYCDMLDNEILPPLRACWTPKALITMQTRTMHRTKNSMWTGRQMGLVFVPPNTPEMNWNPRGALEPELTKTPNDVADVWVEETKAIQFQVHSSLMDNLHTSRTQTLITNNTRSPRYLNKYCFSALFSHSEFRIKFYRASMFPRSSHLHLGTDDFKMPSYYAVWNSFIYRSLTASEHSKYGIEMYFSMLYNIEILYFSTTATTMRL